MDQEPLPPADDGRTSRVRVTFRKTGVLRADRAILLGALTLADGWFVAHSHVALFLACAVVAGRLLWVSYDTDHDSPHAG